MPCQDGKNGKIETQMGISSPNIKLTSNSLQFLFRVFHPRPDQLGQLNSASSCRWRTAWPGMSRAATRGGLPRLRQPRRRVHGRHVPSSDSLDLIHLIKYVEMVLGDMIFKTRMLPLDHQEGLGRSKLAKHVTPSLDNQQLEDTTNENFSTLLLLKKQTCIQHTKKTRILSLKTKAQNTSLYLSFTPSALNS